GVLTAARRAVGFGQTHGFVVVNHLLLVQTEETGIVAYEPANLDDRHIGNVEIAKLKRLKYAPANAKRLLRIFQREFSGFSRLAQIAAKRLCIHTQTVLLL